VIAAGYAAWPGCSRDRFWAACGAYGLTIAESLSLVALILVAYF